VTDAPQPSSRPPLLPWLWRSYLTDQKGRLSVGLVLMVIEGSMLGLLSYMMLPMFDRVFVEGNSDALWAVGFGILAIFIVRALASTAQRVVLTQVRERVAAALRSTLLRHLMALDSSFHQTRPPGQLIERIQGDVTAINQVWTGIVTGLGRDAVALLWLFGVAMWVDWRWTLIALIGVPLLVLPSALAQRYVRRSTRIARDMASRMSTRLDEVFHGINQIKLNSLERYQAERYDALIETRVGAEVRSAFGQAMIPGLIDIMTGIGFFGVLIFGGMEIIEGGKTVGQFMAFFTAIALAFEPLRRLGNISGLWQAAAASVENLFDLLAERPRITSPAEPRRAPSRPPEIRFEGVTLDYGDRPVLRDVSFVAEAGQTTALVGASGAGKSTLFNVLTRLVDPQSGRITVDGTPVTDLGLTDLRGLVSVVSQDAALFDESLRDNILLGRADVEETALDRVLHAAHVADFLPRLPSGLDSPAGPRGSALSGGQRQRIAIARALLRDTPLLLLDEATSALDTKSEAIVQQALDQLSTGRTTLVIAHRLSTVRAAHKIVVMDQGRIVDEGPHDALLARGGLYADLYALQFREEG